MENIDINKKILVWYNLGVGEIYMKKIIYRLILCVFCIIYIFTIFSNLIIACDSHIIECNQYNCEKCLNIQNAKEILEILFFSTCLIHISKNKELVFKILMMLKNTFNFDILLIKVQLNE